MATARPLKSAALFAFVVLYFFVGPLAYAQLSPGDSCSVTGSVSLSNSNPAYLLACNGTTWTLGETITSAGQVGIGTMTPSYSLSVANTGNTAQLQLINTTANAYTQMIYSGTSRTYQTGVGNDKATFFL